MLFPVNIDTLNRCNRLLFSELFCIILFVKQHNKALQLTAGNCGFINVFWVCDGFWFVRRFRRPLAATELFSLGTRLFYNAHK